MIHALKQSRGLISAAARAIGCSHQTIRNYIDRYPEVAEAVIEQREHLVDMAELQLWNRIHEGDTTAIIFTLKTLGKDRGYVEKAQVDVGGQLNHAHEHKHQVDYSVLSPEEMKNLAATYAKLGWSIPGEDPGVSTGILESSLE
jgi:hypothetical protein